VRRLDGSATQRVNLGAQGVQGNLNSLEPSISGDGNLVVFSSDATNLVPGDTNNRTDVFLANVTTHTVSRITGATGGSHPAISADGRFVAFNSDDPNLVPNDTNNHWDIFVKELSTGNFRLASVGANGAPANQTSIFPAISRDGRYVAFMSHASNLVAADTDQIDDVFRRDLTNNTTEWISVAADGGPGRAPNGNPGGALAPAISGNGRHVTFISRSSNLAATPNPNQGKDQAFVRDVDSRRTTYASADNAGAPASGDGVSTSDIAAISGDGRYIAFSSNATNLIGGEPVDDTMDIYVRYSTRAEVRTVTPSTVARGTTRTITLSGAGFLSGATITLSGTGVQVSNTTINGANTAQMTVAVAANAPIGPRDITVTNIGTGPGSAANSVSTCGQCLGIT
jgi:Tol biopolymer transport system component